MKIYFDGCSWTKGAELEHPKEERFSKLICNEFQAEEINFGMSGGSNDRIVRNLYCDNTIRECDLAVIQMTLPARTEYFRNGEWRRVNPCSNYHEFYNGKNLDHTKLNRLIEKFDSHHDFWHYYYMKVSNKEYFDTREKINFETIRDTMRRRGIPLVICTINRYTTLDFDVLLDTNNRNKAKMGHPNAQGHRLIADKILKIIRSYGDVDLL